MPRVKGLRTATVCMYMSLNIVTVPLLFYKIRKFLSSLRFADKSDKQFAFEFHLSFQKLR